MRTGHLPTLVITVLLVGPVVSSAPAGNDGEFAVWPTTNGLDEQQAPDVYGNIIVWQQWDSQYGHYDIYVADVNDPADPWVYIIGDYNDQNNPAIYENTVVWQDYIVWGASEDWDIRMADISNQTAPQIFAVSDIIDNDEQKPAIHGNTVVWQDGAAGVLDIYGADITDPTMPTEFLITNLEHNQQSPAIYRTTVVWQDDMLSDWDVLAADIWLRNKPTELPVSLFEKDQKNPAICGRIVVWQDNFFGDWDIYAADISVGGEPAEFVITTNLSSQENPDIDGNIVVWQDYRNNNWDIFGYNLTTRREFRITDNPYDQTNPAISGNLVVWQDNRDGNWNIYAVVLDGPEMARCASKLTADVNGDCKVNFSDYSAMASHWLECGLEPEETCWQ